MRRTIAASLSLAFLAGGTRAEDESAPRTHHLARAADRVVSLTVSPDGMTLVAGGKSNLIECFDPMNGERRNAFDAHARGAWRVEFVSGFPDWLVSIGIFDDELSVWDPGANKKRGTRRSPASSIDRARLPVELGRLLGVTASPCSDEIAFTELLSGVSFWRCVSGRDGGRLKGTEMCTTVAWSPDGTKLATARPQFADVTSELALRSRANGDVAWVVQMAPAVRTIGTIGWVWPHLAYSPDASYVVCGGARLDLGDTTGRRRSTARIGAFDAATGKRRWLFEREGFTQSVAVAPDSASVLAVVDDKVLRFDAATGKSAAMSVGNPAPTCLAFGPASDRAYVGCADGQILVLDLSTPAPPARAEPSAPPADPAAWRLDPGGDPTCVGVSPDGARIVVGRADGVVSVHDAATGARLRTLDRPGSAVDEVTFVGGENDWLAVQSRDETVRLWNVATGWILRDLGVPFPRPAPGKAPARRLCFAAPRSGKTLTVVYANPPGIRWDLDDGRPSSRFALPDGDTVSLAVTPQDGHAAGIANVEKGQIVWTSDYTGRGFAWTDACGTADADEKHRGIRWRRYTIAPSGDHSVLLGSGQADSASAGALRYFASRSGGRKWTRTDPVPFADVAFRRGDETVFASGPAGVSMLADTTGATRRSLLVAGGPVVRIAFSPDGTRLYGCLAGAREVVRWDVPPP